MGLLSILQHTRKAIRRAADRFECPLLERELRSYARPMRTIAMVAFFTFLIICAILLRPGSARFRSVEIEAFCFVISLVQILALFLLVLFAPTLLSREDEDKGLEFLFLAGMRPSGIYGSKYAAALALTMSLLLLPVPILALGQGLGVVATYWLFTRTLLLLGHGAVLSALGLLAGAYVRKTGGAMLVFIPVCLAWFAGWSFASESMGRRNYLVHAQNVFWGLADFPPRSPSLPVYALVGSLGLNMLIAAGLSVLVCRKLARLAQPEPPRAVRSIRRRAKAMRPSAFGPLIDFAVYNGFGLSAALRHRRLSVIVAVAWCALAAWKPVAALPALLFLAYDIGSTAAHHVQDGVLLDMLLTPAADRRMARLLLVAYARQAWVYVPALLAAYVRIQALMQTWIDSSVATYPAKCALVVAIVLIGFVCALTAMVSAAASPGIQIRQGVWAVVMAPLSAFVVLAPAHLAYAYFMRESAPYRPAHTWWTVQVAHMSVLLVVFALFFAVQHRRFVTGLRTALFEDKATREEHL